MFGIVLYYLVLPFLAAYAVLLFIKKYGAREVPEDIRKLYAERPIEPRWFRVLRLDHKGPRFLADCETQGEAVEHAYKGKEEARKARERAAFLVLNDQGEVLEEVDS